jgi:CRISPR/Cas system-associated exonuclease Cas4 (RecB family)
VAQCLEQGIRVGDSPQRKLPEAVMSQLGQAYSGMVAYSRSAWTKMLAVEHRYTYVHDGIGQVEGVVDAVVEGHDGAIVLVEWKTAREVAAGRRRPYELQARAGALGLRAQGSYAIERIEIIPSLDPSSAQTFSCDERFIAESQRMFDELFRMLQHRDYPAEPDDQCKQCPLKKQCPAWPR